LERLEAWAAATTATEAVRHAVEHPEAEMHALGVLQDTKARRRLAELEAWAAAQPPGPNVEELDRQRAADRWDKANAYSNALARTMANATTCEHRSCMPGRCVYAR
jgi:hypothetical protein